MGVTAGELFVRHGLTVFQYFCRATGSRDLAEDLTQEVFLRVVQGIHRYRPHGRESAWVFQVARTVLLRHWLNQGPPHVSMTEIREPSHQPSPVAAIGFYEAMGLLPRAEREMFLLKEQAGLTYAEIARTCETTEEAVRSKLYRARRLLKRVLSSRLSVDRREGL